MFFRNLQIYHLKNWKSLDQDELNELLSTMLFKPCAGLDTYRAGWVSPLGKQSESLSHFTNNRIMLCLQREERMLPPSVINDALAEKVEQIESAENRTVGRKEKATLKDEIIVDLLPRAFTKRTKTYGYLDPMYGVVVINATSAKKAEEFLSILRETTGALKVVPVSTNDDPVTSMTNWLSETPPDDFALNDEAKLQEPIEGGAIVTLRKQELAADEVASHIDAGKRVIQLAVEWNDRIACTITDDLSIKKLKFLDLVMDEASEVEADDAVARFDADFALMAAEIQQFLSMLYSEFGGVNT